MTAAKTTRVYVPPTIVMQLCRDGVIDAGEAVRLSRLGHVPEDLAPRLLHLIDAYMPPPLATAPEIPGGAA